MATDPKLSRADKLLMALAGASVDIDFEPSCDFEEIMMALINGETWQGTPNTRMEELLLQLKSGGGGGYTETIVWQNPNQDGTVLVGSNNNVEEITYDISSVLGNSTLWDLFDELKINYALDGVNYSMTVDPNIANGQETSSTAAINKNATTNFTTVSKYNGGASYPYVTFLICPNIKKIRVYTTAANQERAKVFSIIGRKANQ